jgi:hypothetical protein
MFSLFTHDRLFIIQSALTHARGAGAGMRRPYAWNVDMTIYHTREDLSQVEPNYPIAIWICLRHSVLAICYLPTNILLLNRGGTV